MTRSQVNHHNIPNNTISVLFFTAKQSRRGTKIIVSIYVSYSSIKWAKMCTYYYLHHHHTEACGRAIDIVVHYVFCAAAKTIPAICGNESFTSTSTSTSPSTSPTNLSSNTTIALQFSDNAPTGQEIQVPCDNIYFDPSQSVDYNDPCATGGCLASPDCTSGKCRLVQLNRHWKCCRCSRGGNRYRWCRHRMRRSPDTFCYHVCCSECTADEGVRVEEEV